MAAEDLLGAGLDIEGWSYLKGEVAQKISELTDRSLILRSTFPMVIRSKLRTDEERKEASEIVLAAIEMKSSIEPQWIAEKVKRDLDSAFGAPWHVVVGESYDFNIDFDFHYLYYLLYGPVAILCWRCGSVLKCEVNHSDEIKKRPHGYDPAKMLKKREISERI